MFLVISSSPNANGLTAACTKAALEGIIETGGEAEHIDLCALKIKSCMVCGNGWGTCREEHRCVRDDDCFAELQKKIGESAGLILVTPVYWGSPSERMKSFMDRFRRCEALKGEAGALAGKKVNLIAAAGGSGGGTLTCLSEMERWVQHVRAIPRERIGITRFDRESVLGVIEQTAAALVRD